MDEWQFLEEVDVIAKWPAEMKKFVLEGGKWSERKQGLEALNQIIEQNPRLSTTSMTIYGELMDEIRKILDRESNIVVVTTTIRTVELLAQGLRNKFGGFIGMVLPFLIKRAKDKKKNVRDAILAAVGAVSDTTNAERLQKDVVDWFSIPSPESKQTLLSFIFAYFCRQTSPDIPFIKAIAPLCVKCASESDVTVRDKACAALGSIKRLMGDGISVFLGQISTDASKMEKIQKNMEEAIEEAKKIVPPSGNSGNSAEKTEILAENSENLAENAENPVGIDSWTLLDAEDVGKKMEKNVETQLVDKNWKERVAGAENVKKEVDSVGRIEISERLREILNLMVKIIEKDVNVNVAALAAQTLTAVAQKARFAYAPIANRSFSIVFDKLKDKKQLLRDALNDLCDAAATTTPLSTYTEAVISGLTSKNPQSRQQTSLFLTRFFAKNDVKTMEIEAVKQLADSILKISNDADKEVREASIRTIAALQKCFGENVAKRLMADVFEDKMKAEKIPAIIESLEAEFGKSASIEMVRLAKQYNLGSGQSISSGGPKKPTGSGRPVQSAPPRRPIAVAGPSTGGGSTRRAPSPAQRAPAPPLPRVATANASTRRAPSPATQRPPQASVAPALKPKPFVARPAPNFGAPRVATVAPTTVTAKPISRGTPRASSSITTGPSSSSSSFSVRPQARVTPIAPNVIRNGGNIPISTGRPVGIARPQTASSGIVPRTRNVSSTTGTVRPASGIARPPSASRIVRPPSRSGSRHEIN